MHAGMRVGLTGGIGSGKSTFGQMLVALGAALIDADHIARAVTGPGGAAMPAIREAFGDGYVDARGALDRDRMRQTVFQRPAARLQLEAIVHPLVTQRTAEEAASALGAGARAVIFDIPLLAESGRWAHRLDTVITMDCSPDTQIERVTRRSGLDAAEVQRIIASQASRRARRAIADIVVMNDSAQSIDALQALARQTAAQLRL